MAKPAEARIGPYVVHPLRRVIPEMTPADFAALVAAMKAVAAAEAEHRRASVTVAQDRDPIFDVYFDAEGRVLDGRARLKACLALGLEFNRRSPSSDGDVAFILRSMAVPDYPKALRALTAARLLGDLEAERAGRKIFTGRITEAAGELVGGVSVPYITESKAILDALTDPTTDDANRKTLAEMVAFVDTRILRRFTHVRALFSMNPVKRAKALAKIRDGGKGSDPAVVLHNAAAKNGDEWYTPLDVAVAVKWAFGGEEIPCDPCAPVGGGSPVTATLTYNELEDGLDDRNAWADGTFVNPPFSVTRDWIAKAIREAADGKRIYMLLPVRPSAMYQQALINASIDVLLLDRRLSFVLPPSAEEPDADGPKASTGRSALMIVGLGCSTEPLLRMGIEGLMVRGVGRASLYVSPDRKEWVLTRRDPEPLPDWYHAMERSDDEDRAVEFAEAAKLLKAQVAVDQSLIARGRIAVHEARIKMAREETAKKKKREAQSARKPSRPKRIAKR